MRAACLLLLSCVSIPAAAIDIVVDVLGDPVPDGCSPGSCSLREAVDLANLLPGPDRILLPATPDEPIQLSRDGPSGDGNASGDLNITDELEIVGQGREATRIVQTAPHRIFHVGSSSVPLTLRGMTLSGGNPIGEGGAVYAYTLREVDDVKFVGNHSPYEGGAILLYAGFGQQTPEVVVRNSHFVGNTTSGGGGAITFVSNTQWDYALRITVEDSVFEDNIASLGGGAIQIRGGVNGGNAIAEVRRSRFSGNSAGDAGAIGGGSSVAFDLELSDCLFEDNTATRNSSSGGAVIGSRNLVVQGSRFERNRAFRGGAVSIAGTLLEVHDSTLCDNEAETAGGAIIGAGGVELDIQRSTFCRNETNSTNSGDTGGGAIAVTDNASLLLRNTTLHNNDAYRGGAISFESTGDLRIENTTVVPPNLVLTGTLGTALRMRNTSAAASHIVANTLLRGTCTFGAAGDGWDGAMANIESPGDSCRLNSATLPQGNQVQVSVSALQLGPLADNGGPTRTVMPGVGSALINAGNAILCPAEDQRGYARTGPDCDVGAVQTNAAPLDDFVFGDGFEPL